MDILQITGVFIDLDIIKKAVRYEIEMLCAHAEQRGDRVADVLELMGSVIVQEHHIG